MDAPPHSSGSDLLTIKRLIKGANELKNIEIKTDYITLGQFLKLADVIQTGGHAKFFLAENEVLVNDLTESRRGRKLFVQDRVKIDGHGEFRIIRQG